MGLCRKKQDQVPRTQRETRFLLVAFPVVKIPKFAFTHKLNFVPVTLLVLEDHICSEDADPRK
jgi:hypothetical protein